MFAFPFTIDNFPPFLKQPNKKKSSILRCQNCQLLQCSINYNNKKGKNHIIHLLKFIFFSF